MNMSSSIANVVSIDLGSSWAAQNLQEAIRQTSFDARFQQKQMQEKEEKLLRLFENQQQRAIDRVNRDSAGSNTSTKSLTHGGGKVRQMFDEIRRQKAGIDRSYPLEPLNHPKSNGKVRANSLDRIKNDTNTKTIVKSTIRTNVSHVKNGKPLINKRDVMHSMYNNNNGDENYEEIIYQNDNRLRSNGTILNKTYRQRDLENIINNFRVSIDDEEFPDMGIDIVDSPVKHKPANLGGKLYTETRNVPKQAEQRVYNRNEPYQPKVTSPVKNNTKSVIKKTTYRPVTNPTETAQLGPSRQSPVSPTTPIRGSKSETSSNMSSSATTKNQRTPSAARPSSNQPRKGPTSTVNRDNLDGCRYCGRRFASDRLTVHENICSKTAQKKRKVFDATKHRVEGTDLEQYARKGNRSKKPANDQQGAGTISKPKQQVSKQAGNAAAQPQPKSDWKRKHEEFIGAIRAAKAAQAHVAKGGKLSDLPPPPPSLNPDYVQCPHCGRRFNQTAAERHIPKCASFEFNKPKGSQGTVGKNSNRR